MVALEALAPLALLAQPLGEPPLRDRDRRVVRDRRKQLEIGFRELARHRILVNALAPGYVETDFNREFFKTEAGQRLISRIPLKRIAQPEDLDGALLFLASPASAYVTGAVISIDGGHGVAAI